MVMVTVILLLLNIILGGINIVKYALEEEWDKKIGAAIFATLNWVAVFVLIMTLLRQVQ